MRSWLVVAPWVAVASVAWALAPEDPADRARLNEAVADMRKACDSNVKVDVDLAAFDAESIRNGFSPTRHCTEVVKALTKACENGPDVTDLWGPVDPVPVFDITEVRCTLDKKHEDAFRAWLKTRRDPKSPGPTPESLFKDIPNSTNPDVSARNPEPIITWNGNSVVVGLMSDCANDEFAVWWGVRRQVKALSDKPGYAQRRKSVMERITKKRGSADEARWHKLAAANPGAVRKAEKVLKDAAARASGTCKVPITASVDWASLEAQTTESCTQPPCTDEDRVVAFAGMCDGVLSGVEEACKDDELWPVVKAKVKSVSCRFDRLNGVANADVNFPVEMKGTSLEVRMNWSAGNIWSVVNAGLKKKL